MSVDFEVVKLGPKKRRVDPVVFAILAVVIAVGVAIIKPWDGAQIGAAPSPSDAAAIASPDPAMTPTTRPTPTPAPTPPPDLAWTDLAGEITAHDAWGIRTLVVGRRAGVGAPPPLRYSDRWSPITTDGSGVASAYVDRDERSIAVLGLTYPATEVARDARIWRIHANDRLEWVETALVDHGTADTSLLFVRPGRSGGPFEAWEAGRYRIDVLLGTEVRRVEVAVANRFGSVPQPDVLAPAQTGLVAARDSDPSAIRIGMFATVDGTAVSIGAPAYRPLGEAEAWDDRLRTGGLVVADAFVPRATGLGVMLTAHADIQAGTITRLAPAGRFEAPEMQGGLSPAQSRTPYVYFAAPDGEAWPPGVYSISLIWTDGAGPHDGTWHVELRPGPG